MSTLGKQLLEEDAVMDQFTGDILRWAGSALIFLVGGAHVLIAGEHFLAAPYLGVLFLANFFGAVAAAVALYWSASRLGWLLGDLVAGGAFVGFIVSRVAGLPGVTEFVGQWFNIAGLLALMVEGAFLTLSLLVLTPQGRALVRTEQGRMEQERMPPAMQETPAHFEALEKEMAGIRLRIDPDLRDLRKHAEPQMVKEQVERNLRGRLHAVPTVLKNALQRPGPLASLAFLAIATVLVARGKSGGDD